jgi:hypothetical protein
MMPAAIAEQRSMTALARPRLRRPHGRAQPSIPDAVPVIQEGRGTTKKETPPTLARALE